MANPQINISDMQSWVTDERADAPKARQAVLDSLNTQLENEKKLPQPDQLKPGSPERLVAEARQRRISHLAANMGYVSGTAEVTKEVVKEAVTHTTGIPLTADSQIKMLGALAQGKDPEIVKELKNFEGHQPDKPGADISKMPPKAKIKEKDDGMGFGFSL